MIKIELEHERWHCDAPEKCVFCGTTTRFWHKESNTPVCQNCALIHDVDRSIKLLDIPKTISAC